MTEQEFIEKYVAENAGRIETGVCDHNLTRAEMMQCTMDHAREAWTILHEQLVAEQQLAAEQPEQELATPPTAWLQRSELYFDEVYVGIPEDAGDLRKVIFCPCDSFIDGFRVRFALYEESVGDIKLMINDKGAHHAMSYHSDKCVCMAKDIVGIDFNQLPDMRFRLPNGDELKLLNNILDSCDLSISATNNSMWIGQRRIN